MRCLKQHKSPKKADLPIIMSLHDYIIFIVSKWSNCWSQWSSNRMLCVYGIISSGCVILWSPLTVSLLYSWEFISLSLLQRRTSSTASLTMVTANTKPWTTRKKKRNNKSDDWNYILVFNSHLCVVRCTHQRSPVGVQIPYLQRWNKLRTSYYQKIQVEEELKLLVKNLKQKKEKAAKINNHHHSYLMKIW